MLFSPGFGPFMCLQWPLSCCWGCRPSGRLLPCQFSGCFSCFWLFGSAAFAGFCEFCVFFLLVLLGQLEAQTGVTGSHMPELGAQSFSWPGEQSSQAAAMGSKP